MYERIQKICNHLRKESENQKINEEINFKFSRFKNWLLQNGAIFEHYLEFPVIYSPFLKIGCKTKEDINENESFLMIPENLIIKSEDLKYLDKYIINIKEEISEKDLNLLYIILYLYLERKNEKSFYQPFLDVIFIEEDIIYNQLNKDNTNELNDELAIKSMEKRLDKINEIYELIIKCEKFSEIKKKEFIELYFKIKSRIIELNDNLALIPLLDLFCIGNSTNLKYEIYDSENMIFKYTSLINNKTNFKFNLYMTKSKYLPFNKPSYNKLIPIKVEYNDVEEEEEEENKKELNINKNDYFSVAISKNNKILKNNIICSNNELCNKKLLKNKGFCLLYNKNDFLEFNINFERGYVLIDKYLENIFEENYETKNDNPIYNYIKIKIYFNFISTDLLKYFRFMYFYKTKNNAKEYFKYSFNLDIEINIINSSIEFLENKLKQKEKKFPFEKDLEDLEKQIYNNKEQKDYLKINLIIFRLSQAIILKNQINLLNYILNIMKKYNVNGYNNIYDYLSQEKIVNDYDIEENIKLKILRFIAYMSQNVDLKNISKN